MSRSQTWTRAALAALVSLLLVAAYLLSPASWFGTDSAAEDAPVTTMTLETQAARTPAKPQQATPKKTTPKPPPSPAARARAAVRTAVQKARKGAPIPTRTTPALSALNGSRFDLGRCDYGSHDDSGGRLCPRGDTKADRTLVVLGDSHGKHWVAALQKAAKRYGWKAYYLVKEKCTAPFVYNGDPEKARPTEPWAACEDFRTFAVKSVDKLDPDLVIVSTSIPTKGVFYRGRYIDNQEDMVAPYKAGYRTLFKRLKAGTDGRIVLLRDVPARKPGTDPLNCFRKKGNDLGDCLSPQGSQASRVKLIDASVATAKSSGVKVVDPTPFFCWDDVCPAAIGKGLLPYRNTSHLTVDYAAHLTGALAQILRLK